MIKERKWGLVLAGGGGKGAYQIGVMKALKEYGLLSQIVEVSGSSIGALNAILFAQNDMEKIEEIWKGIEPEEILDVSISGTDIVQEIKEKYGVIEDFLDSISMDEYLQKAKKEGLCSREGLVNIIEKEVDLQKVIDCPQKIYATIAKMESGIPVAQYCLLNDKTKEEITQILLASSALPVVYDAVEINGISYRDGGLADNVPKAPLLADGVQNLIVVRLKKEEMKIEKNSSGVVNYLEITPSHTLGDFITGTIDFSHESILYRMSLGYYDGMRMLKELELMEAGMPTEALDLKMQLMENHNRAVGDTKRAGLFEQVNAHINKFKEIESRF